MNCFECVLKHLAGALSYGKQVISGHGKGADLDHRIDCLGEIKNAEDHLQLIDNNLFIQVSSFRKELQARRVLIDESDLQKIREFYLMVENLDENNNFSVDEIKPIQPMINNPDIVIDYVSNINYFDLIYKSIKKYLSNYEKIIVLNADFDIDLSKYEDVNLIDLTLNDYARDKNTSKDFILIPENACFINPVDARFIPPTFNIINGNKNYLNLKPQPVNRDEFIKYGDIVKYFDNIVTTIDNNYTVIIREKICCSVKNAMKIKQFARWNENGFEYLKDFLHFD